MVKRTLLMVFMAGAAGALGAEVTFEWDASPDPTVTGYRLYVERQSSNQVWTNAVSVPASNTWATATNLAASTDYRAFVTATNAMGLESDPSERLAFRVPVGPVRLKVRPRLETASSVEGPWRALCDLGEVEVAATEGQAFYRVRMEIGP